MAKIISEKKKIKTVKNDWHVMLGWYQNVHKLTSEIAYLSC
jgi:hypothetical protein